MTCDYPVIHRPNGTDRRAKHRGLVTAMVIGMLAWLGAPAGADEDAPVAAQARIILHGVDCSVDNGTICLEDRPVFDEVFDTLDWDERPLVIQPQIVDMCGDELPARLSPADAEAVRDYFVAGGVAPQQVGIGDAGIALSGEADRPIGLQLSRRTH